MARDDLESFESVPDRPYRSDMGPARIESTAGESTAYVALRPDRPDRRI